MSNKSHNNWEKLPHRFWNKSKWALQAIPLAAALVCGNPSINAPLAIWTWAAIATTLTSCDPHNKPIDIDTNEAPRILSIQKNVEAESQSTLTSNWHDLKLWNDIIASFDDDYSKTLSISVKIDGQSQTLPFTFQNPWTYNLSLEIKDSWNGSAPAKSTSASITITITDKETPIKDSDVVESLETRNPTLKVWTPINFLSQWPKFINWWKLDKVIIEQNWHKIEINASDDCTPTEAWEINFTFCLVNWDQTYQIKSSKEVEDNILKYNAVIPSKLNIYPEFNNQNVEAHKREWTYEMLALANQCLDKNRRKENGLKVIMQSPWYNSWIQKYKSHFDSHEEECYRNLNEWTWDTENIYGVSGRYKDIEKYLNNWERNDTNIAYTTSRNLTDNTNLDNLNQNPHYQALKRLWKSNNFLWSIANWNANETDKDYKLSDDITDTSTLPENWYEYRETAAAKNDNNIQAVVCWYAKDKIIFKLYCDETWFQENSSCPLISKDNEIFVRCCSPFPTKDYNTLNADWWDYTRWNTSYATPALTAQWKNIYDVCHSLWIVNNMTELKALITKYARKVPCFIQTKNNKWEIVEQPCGYAHVTDTEPIIEHGVIPAIISQFTKEWNYINWYKPESRRIAYQWAWREYQDDDWTWKTTDWVNPKDYVNKPQHKNSELASQYEDQKTTMYFMNWDWDSLLKYDIGDTYQVTEYDFL